MTELESLRNEIDRVDADLADLFCRRMEIVKKIARCKKEAGLPLFDKAREDEIFALHAGKIDDLFLLPYYKEFLDKLLALSKAYQKELGGKA